MQAMHKGGMRFFAAQSAAEIRRNRSPARTFASLEKNRGKTVDILRMVCYNDRG